MTDARVSPLPVTEKVRRNPVPTMKTPPRACILRLIVAVAVAGGFTAPATFAAATDGTENAVGVLAGDVDATLIDREDSLLIARHAIVASHALVWPVAVTPTEKATAIAQLDARGVLVRTAA